MEGINAGEHTNAKPFALFPNIAWIYVFDQLVLDSKQFGQSFITPGFLVNKYILEELPLTMFDFLKVTRHSLINDSSFTNVLLPLSD